MGFRRDAERERDRLNRQLRAVRERLAEMPEGDFACYANGGRFKWFRVREYAGEKHVGEEYAGETAARGDRGADRPDARGSSTARGKKAGREAAEVSGGQLGAEAARGKKGGRNAAEAGGGGSHAAAARGKKGGHKAAEVSGGQSGAEAAHGKKKDAADGRLLGKPVVRGKHIYEYIPQAQAELAGVLALKRYWKSREQDLQCEIDGLDYYLNKVQRGCGHAEKELANPGIAELVRPQIARRNDRDGMVEAWLREDYQRSVDHPENLKIPTIGGFMVRSKSEALIADLLIEYRLPFRYECGVIFGGYVRYPDFTILNPVNGQTVIWEHLGMMGSQTYQSEYAGKISTYISNGYIPYVNLITTFETKEQPFDVAAADRVVKIMFGEYLESLERE